MSAAPIIDETPNGHAYELSCMHTCSNPTVDRIRSIAEQYTGDIHDEVISSPPYRELHFELKNVRDRFHLWDMKALNNAIHALQPCW